MPPTFRLACPACGAACTVLEESRGKPVRCPTCQKPFQAGAAPAVALPVAAAPPPPPRPARPPEPDTEPDSADFPAVSGPVRRRRNSGGGVGTVLLVLAGVGLFVVAGLVLAGVGIWYVLTPKPQPVVQAPTKPEPPPPPPPEPTKPAAMKRASAEDLAIRPPPMDSPKEVRTLPGVVKDVAVAGDGRFLLLHAPKERKLAVFDANEGKVVRSLGLTDDDARVVAGHDKVFIVSPAKKRIQRFDLLTFAPEASAPLAVKGTVDAVLLGSASDGPLWIGVSEKPGVPSTFGGPGSVFLDQETLKPVDVKAEPYHALDGPTATISADGTLVVGSSGGRPVTAVVGKGTVALHAGGDDSPGVTLPAPDGKLAYGPGVAATPELTAVPAAGGEFACVPAVHGAYYLRFVREAPKDAGGDPLVPGMTKRKPGRNPSPGVEFFKAGESLPFAARVDINPAFPAGEEMPAGEMPAGDKNGKAARPFLIPKAHLLVVLPPDGKRLLVYQCDVDAAARGAGEGPSVTSDPPTKAARGARFEYAPEVKSEKGEARVRIDEGPDRMRTAGDTKVTWDVPADFSGDEAKVLLSVADASGWAAFQSFSLAVEMSTKPPMPMTGEIQPPTLKGGRQTVDLLAPVGDLAVGGGGRYLVLSIPKRREVKVFDVTTAKVVRSIGPVGDARVAAGRDKFVVASPEDKKLRRYSLATGKEEASATLDAAPWALAMGSASDGPVLVGGRLLDLETLAPSEDGGGMPFDLPAGAAPDANTVARASADGRTFAWWRPESTPQGLCVLSRGEDGKWAFARGTVSPGYAVPSPDGQRIFTLKGTFGLDARPLPGGNALALTLPATSGEGFVRLGETTAKDGFQGATAFREAGGKPAVSEPDVELAPAVDQWKRVPLAFDRRVVFVPEAKLLILVPSAGEKLLLRLLD